MNPKTKEILLDIAHELNQAIITDDDAIASHALADVADALASILPLEHPASPLTPPIPGATADAPGRACRPATADPDPQGYAKFLTVAPGVQLVRFAGNDNIVLMARRKGRSGNPNTIFSIHVNKKSRTASVNRDNRELLYIAGSTCRYSMVEHCAISALHRYLKDQRPCKAKRRRAARLRAEQSEI